MSITFISHSMHSGGSAELNIVLNLGKCEAVCHYNIASVRLTAVNAPRVVMVESVRYWAILCGRPNTTYSSLIIVHRDLRIPNYFEDVTITKWCSGGKNS